MPHGWIMTEGVNPLRLYSMMICPFAQRIRIHLQLKGFPFQLEELDICRPRPSWFLKLNPTGQVPVLLNGDDVVCDSTIISEYIEESLHNPLPFGGTPARRARIRSAIKYIDSHFVPALYQLMAARTAEERAERIDTSLITWRWLNDFLASVTVPGDFVDGKFGLAEIAIAPFLLRYEVVRHYQEFAPPSGPDYEHVAQWRDQILSFSVVRSTAESVEDLIKLYEDYSYGHYSGSARPGQSLSSLDLSVPPSTRSVPPKSSSVQTGG